MDLSDITGFFRDNRMFVERACYCLTEKVLEGTEDEIKYDRNCVVVLS